MIRILLTICSLLSIICLNAQPQSWQQRGFKVENDTSVNFFIPTVRLSSLSLEARCAITEKNTKKYNQGYFGIQWALPNNKICAVTARDLSGKSSQFLGQNEVEISITVTTPDNSTEFSSSKILTQNVSTDGGANTMQIQFSDSTTIINFGNSFLSNKLQIPKQYAFIPENASFVTNSPSRVYLLSSKWNKDKQHPLLTDWNKSLINQQITDNSGENAIWKYLDRQTDNRYTRLGGKYYIATVKEPDGSISIIYLSGAKTNSSLWHEGMLKGKMFKNLLQNDYELQWFDSEMNLIENECHATLNDEKTILSLYFPLLKSTLRFIRLPKDM